MTSRYTVGRGGKASLLGRSLSPKPVAYVAIRLPNPLKTNIVGPHGEEAGARRGRVSNALQEGRAPSQTMRAAYLRLFAFFRLRGFGGGL